MAQGSPGGPGGPGVAVHADFPAEKQLQLATIK